MLIDVIIPTFNRAPVLTRAIDSVLNQTVKNFTIHVVDDGSTDETASVLKKYSQHPQVKIHVKKNSGVSAARNFGVAHSSSEWISFLDSDDEWLATKLEKQCDYVKNNPSTQFLHSEEQWIRNGVRVNPKKKHSKESEDLLHRSLNFCLISPSTVLMKRDLFLLHGGFDEELVVCEDYDLWIKILIEQSAGFIPEALIKKYGGHADQLSTKYFAMDYWRIKSLFKIYSTYVLNAELKLEMRSVIKTKCELLLKNYAKYENQTESLEITAILIKISSDI